MALLLGQIRRMRGHLHRMLPNRSVTLLSQLIGTPAAMLTKIRVSPAGFLRLRKPSKGSGSGSGLRSAPFRGFQAPYLYLALRLRPTRGRRAQTNTNIR